MTDPRAVAVAAMLAARSVAVVGASPRPGSFGARMVSEVLRGGQRRVHLVNPNYAAIGDRPCLPKLQDVDEPVDLALLGVGDDRVVEQLAAAAECGARSAVVFGGVPGDERRAELRRIAVEAGMALCGGGCMGFVNVTENLRAVGYVEPDELPAGPIALVSHSGSVFSALLRTRRALGFTIAVSSGQELVTTSADYLDHVLAHTDTRVVGLVLETIREGARLTAALRAAADRDVPMVLLPVGGSPRGAALVQAHSGALAGWRGRWEALAEGTGALLVSDLAEFTDTLELLAIGRRPSRRGGIATVHDSGAERALAADLAHELGVPFASLGASTRARLDALLDVGLAADNPLDVWGVGTDSRVLLAACLGAVSADPGVAVTALAVDLVAEYDGDTSYPDAVLDATSRTTEPVVVLANLASAVDLPTATHLRAAGVPVLEGTRSGLVALRHLLALADRRAGAVVARADRHRQARWRARLADRLDGAASFALLADYGVPVTAVRAAGSADDAVHAAELIGYPVVLKTDAGVAHKSDVDGVRLGLAVESALRTAYADLASRLGPRVLVCAAAGAGVEVAVGIVRDPQLGPLLVVAAGGTLAELLTDRAVALPPVNPPRAENLLQRLRIRPLLEGWRGEKPADVAALVDVVVAVGQLAAELGDDLVALDVNPVLVSPSGAVAVDVLVQPRL